MPPRKKSATAKPAKKGAQKVSSRGRSTPSARATAKPTKKETQPSLEDQVAAVLTSRSENAIRRSTQPLWR
jgi:hypothetical protein